MRAEPEVSEARRVRCEAFHVGIFDVCLLRNEGKQETGRVTAFRSSRLLSKRNQRGHRAAGVSSSMRVACSSLGVFARTL